MRNYESSTDAPHALSNVRDVATFAIPLPRHPGAGFIDFDSKWETGPDGPCIVTKMDNREYPEDLDRQWNALDALADDNAFTEFRRNLQRLILQAHWATQQIEGISDETLLRLRIMLKMVGMCNSRDQLETQLYTFGLFYDDVMADVKKSLPSPTQVSRTLLEAIASMEEFSADSGDINHMRALQRSTKDKNLRTIVETAMTICSKYSDVNTSSLRTLYQALSGGYNDQPVNEQSTSSRLVGIKRAQLLLESLN